MSGPRRRSGLARHALLAIACLACAPDRGAPRRADRLRLRRPPGQLWGGGYGGMLTITLLQPGPRRRRDRLAGRRCPDTHVLLVAGKVYVGPSIGRLVPYAGLGAGYYAEGKPVTTQAGSFGEVFVGAKIKLPLGLLVRGEVQWLSLSIPLDDRFSWCA